MSNNHTHQLPHVLNALREIQHGVELGCNVTCAICMAIDGAWDVVNNVRRLMDDERRERKDGKP